MRDLSNDPDSIETSPAFLNIPVADQGDMITWSNADRAHTLCHDNLRQARMLLSARTSALDIS